MVLTVVLRRAMTACCRTRRPWRSVSVQPACYISAVNVDVLSSCFVSWLLMCRLCWVKGGRDVPARVTFPMEYAHLLRGVGVSSILIISNTVSGPPGSTPLGEPEVYVDILFCKSIIIFPARQQKCLSCMSCFNDFEAADRRCRHRFLLHVPCETRDANLAPLFSQREHDSESLILDLNFSVLHRVSGATIPMVRRTSAFIATNSAFKTNCILTFSVCSALSVT